MKQIALTSLLLSAVLLLACSEQPTTEKYQKSRDNIVDVKDKVVEINTGDVLIGGNSDIFFLDDYWMVVEYGSTIMDKLVHLFDRTTYKPVLDAVRRGQGPGEFANHGIPIVDEAHHCFYLPDNSRMKVYTFYIDSLLSNPDWQPKLKCSFPEERIPSACVYVNDTLCIGRVILPIGTNDFRTGVCCWNMETGTIRIMPYEHPQIKKKRATCTVSPENDLYIDVYDNHDLLTVCDLDGNLKCNIYGPDWRDGDRSDRLQHIGATVCGDKIITLYSGIDNREENAFRANLLHVFDLEGNYLKTLDIGYDAFRMVYDARNNRLLFVMDDEIQFGYLPLEGLL